MTPTAFYNACYTILVDHGRAMEFDRQSFVAYFVDNATTTEWRFQGMFGFGGKFWRNNGRHYVNYNKEDHTSRLDEALAHVNDLIAALPGPVA